MFGAGTRNWRFTLSNGHPPATSATIATRASVRPPVSQKSQVSQSSQPGGADHRVAEVAIVARSQLLRNGVSDPEESSSSHASLPLHDLSFDAFEERAAIRQFDGGQTKDEAECAALIDVAAQFRVTTACLRKRWLADPDTKAYLAFVVSRDPTPLQVAASGLGWPLERAWAAEARLRACGLLRNSAAPVATD